MSGSTVRQLLVDDDAAALADRQAAPRAPARRAGGCRRRTRSCRSRARCRRRTSCACTRRRRRRRSPACSLPVCTRDAERLDLAAQHARRRRRRPAPPSGAARTRRRGSRGRGPAAPSPLRGPAGRRRSPRRRFARRARRRGSPRGPRWCGRRSSRGRSLPGDRRHERVRAGGEHQLVVGEVPARCERHGLGGAVDGVTASPTVDGDAGALVDVRARPATGRRPTCRRRTTDRPTRS